MRASQGFQRVQVVSSFSEIREKPADSASSSLRIGFVYGLFISAPQQHLGFLAASLDGLVTSISQPQREFRQR